MEKEQAEHSRRRFLRLTAAAVPAAIAVSVAPNSVAKAVKSSTPSRGLRDTEHTRKYLASARF